MEYALDVLWCTPNLTRCSMFLPGDHLIVDTHSVRIARRLGNQADDAINSSFAGFWIDSRLVTLFARMLAFAPLKYDVTALTCSGSQQGFALRFNKPCEPNFVAGEDYLFEVTQSALRELMREQFQTLRGTEVLDLPHYLDPKKIAHGLMGHILQLASGLTAMPGRCIAETIQWKITAPRRPSSFPRPR